MKQVSAFPVRRADDRGHTASYAGELTTGEPFPIRVLDDKYRSNPPEPSQIETWEDVDPSTC